MNAWANRSLENLMADSSDHTKLMADEACIAYHQRMLFLHEHLYVETTDDAGKQKFLFNPNELWMLVFDPNTILSRAFRAELYDPPIPNPR